ncbi:MAG: UPF0236 family protein [Eubacteriales bacterium]|nr:UPF0236 family protein [Eubacteriales bacterium]
MEQRKKFEVCEEVFDVLSSFQSMQDMIIYLVGYAEDIYNYVKIEEKKMNMVFPERMFNKKILKQLEKEDSLEDMQNTLTEYCRQLLEKAINKKSKKLYEHFMEYSIAERHKMFGLQYKGKSDLLPSNNETTLATVFGNIRYVRYGVYVPTRVNSARVFAPIDDYLNVIQNIQYPKPVLKRIGSLITKLSYRDTSKELEKYNITISKQNIWNLVRDVIAPRIYDYEKEKTIDFLLGNQSGDKKKVSTLFIEWDGVWLSLDNTKDESQKTGKKREMKLGKAYIGWAERYGKGNNKSYKTVGTKYVAGFEAPTVLRTMLHGKIDEAFDYANVEQIIVGGDGAKWIFQDYDLDARVTLQLDMFHIKQRINRCIKNKEMKKKICRLIEEDKYLELIEMLRTNIESRIREEDVKKEKELLEYLDNNFSALKRYQKTRIVKVDSKMEARNLGTMEASVRQVLGRRMKMSAWSMEGARAMATMLCLEHEGKLEEVLDVVLDRQYKFKYSDVNLEKFVLEYLLKEDMEMMKKGQEANQKVIARGKYAKAIANVEIDFKSILKKNNTIARYIPKSLY